MCRIVYTNCGRYAIPRESEDVMPKPKPHEFPNLQAYVEAKRAYEEALAKAWTHA